jgi:hypothetical protein
MTGSGLPTVDLTDEHGLFSAVCACGCACAHLTSEARDEWLIEHRFRHARLLAGSFDELRGLVREIVGGVDHPAARALLVELDR